MTFQKGNRRASKLTGEQVIEIRDRYTLPGVTIKRLALDYGVSRNTISSILDGLTWRDIPGGQAPVYRPPLNPQPGPQDKIDASLARLAALMEPKQVSLYNDPPPAEAEDSRAKSVFTKLTDQISDELDKLEKGD